MPAVQGVIDARIKALQRQVQNIKNFVTQPSGIFETIDEVIKTTRYANRATLSSLGIQGQGLTLQRYGYVGTQGPILSRVRDIIGNIRKRIGR